MKTWVKVYTEINRDPDIGTLTWAQRGIWTALLALAGEIDDKDENEKETGKLDAFDRVAWSIRCDFAELRDAVDEFTKRGMIRQDDDTTLWLPNYPKRQARPPSAKPSAVAERVKRHRAQAKAECNDVTLSMKRAVTPTDTDTETDSEPDTDSEKRQRQTAEQTAPPAVDADECLRVVRSLGIEEPKASELVRKAARDGILATLAGDLEAWIEHYRLEDGIKKPIGLAITQVEARITPPNRVPSGKEGAYLPY